MYTIVCIYNNNLIPLVPNTQLDSYYIYIYICLNKWNLSFRNYLLSFLGGRMELFISFHLTHIYDYMWRWRQWCQWCFWHSRLQCPRSDPVWLFFIWYIFTGSTNWPKSRGTKHFPFGTHFSYASFWYLMGLGRDLDNSQ